MNYRGGYFSLEGAAFQVAGDDSEFAMNLAAAMKIVKTYIEFGGHCGEVCESLHWIQIHFPKAKPICERMKLHVALDDMFDNNEKFSVLKDEFTKLHRRVSP